jgi:YbbR domain-containing protein
LANAFITFLYCNNNNNNNKPTDTPMEITAHSPQSLENEPVKTFIA